MTIGGEYDSPQKAAIRERLWDSAIIDLIEHHDRKGGDLTILDLPGARCTYLQHLITRFGFAKANMIGVERLEPAFLSIHHFLGGQGVAFHSLVEELCENKALATYLPADVVNLDFCGQGFVFPVPSQSSRKSDYQRRWDCVKSLLEFNKQKEQEVWYLLLTLACARNNPAGKEFLLDQLNDLRKLTGISKDPSKWKDNRLIQEVVPKIVAEEALHQDYVPVAEHCDSYRYVQDGHTYPMVAWKFKLVLDTKKTLGHKVTKKKDKLEEFCKAYFKDDGKQLEDVRK